MKRKRLSVMTSGRIKLITGEYIETKIYLKTPCKVAYEMWSMIIGWRIRSCMNESHDLTWHCSPYEHICKANSTVTALESETYKSCLQPNTTTNVDKETSEFHKYQQETRIIAKKKLINDDKQSKYWRNLCRHYRRL